jgi:hypothetical protein
MYIAQDFVVSTILKSSAQRASVFQILEGDCPIPSESKVEEHEVLGDDRSGRTTEVEGERIFNRTEVMEFENEILRKVALRTPDDPTDADRSKTKLVYSIKLSIRTERSNS